MMIKQRTGGLLAALILLLGSLTACSRAESQPGNTASAMPQTARVSSTQSSVDAGPAPRLPSTATRNPTPLQPNGALMMETIDALCAAPRPLGSDREEQAAQFLKARLAEYGYKSKLERFSYNITQTTIAQRYQQAQSLPGEDFLWAAFPGDAVDGTSQNVVGRQPGEDDKEKILILSAHYDSTPDSIGVVDNAAGVAVVLEAARLLAEDDLPFSVRIVLFGGEEEILIGSRQHVANMASGERARILGNISVDTLAYSPKEEFVVLTPLSLPRQDAATLAEASPLAAAFLADSRVEPSFQSQLVGDHIAFSAAGIDSVNFGQLMDAVSDIINSPADTYDHLEPELLPVAAGLLADTVRELARQTAG